MLKFKTLWNYLWTMNTCSVPQFCPTLCDPMDCSPPGTSVPGISQARKLEWVAISCSGDLPDPEIEPTSAAFSCIDSWILFHGATREAPVNYIVVVVQSPSHVWLFAAPWTAAGQASLSFDISWSLLKHLSTELVIPSNHLILCCPVLLLPSIFPSIRVCSSESGLHIKSIGTSASTSFLPMNIQGWFPLGLTGLISLQSKEFSRVFSITTILKHQFFDTQLSLWSSFHIRTWLLEKPWLWLYGPLLGQTDIYAF